MRFIWFYWQQGFSFQLIKRGKKIPQIGKASDSNRYVSQRASETVLVTCLTWIVVEVVSSQVLAPETLKIKRTTRDQSSTSSVFLTFWCELQIPGVTVRRHTFSFLTCYGPSSSSSPPGCPENLPFMLLYSPDLMRMLAVSVVGRCLLP